MQTNPYSFRENFSCLGDDHLPYSFEVERNSAFRHGCVRQENGAFFISCYGNKFLAKTPDLHNVDLKTDFAFHYGSETTGCLLFFRYHEVLRTGWKLEALMDAEKETKIRLYRLNPETVLAAEVSLPTLDPTGDTVFTWNVSVREQNVTGSLGGYDFSMTMPEAAPGEKGRVGLSFLQSLGEMTVKSFEAVSDDPIESRVLCAQRTVEIPLRNGGNMPYTLTYSLREIDGKPYLSYVWDGGSQYREQYPDYPHNVAQYDLEEDRIWSPFLKLYRGVGDETVKKARLHDGMMTVTDPVLHWKDILVPFFGVVWLPIQGVLPLWELKTPVSPDELTLAFGYAFRRTSGYRMQSEHDVEFCFRVSDGTLLYEGTEHGVDAITVTSGADKHAVAMIPDTVYRPDLVRAHMAKNHFFDEDEPLTFTASVAFAEGPRFFTLKAVLCDVYGDPIGDMTVTPDPLRPLVYQLTYPPQKVGVYRICLSGFAGTEKRLEKEVLLEVYDKTGKRCAPLESGLPFLFSTPNEQKFLDRDAFDPWSPFPGCDTEHLYACTSYTGDIGARKRTWEVCRLFGRPWYVWLNSHRTMTNEEVEKYYEVVTKNAEYFYYEAINEIHPMRHDYYKIRAYQNSILLRYLDDFMDLHPEIPLSIPHGLKSMNQQQLDHLLSTCLAQWVDYANERFLAYFREDNKRHAALNPTFKRACYGPCNIYVIPSATHNMIRYFGFIPDQTLAEDVYDGFCQLEDYPVSCNYHTYRGAFLVMNLLLHIPGLAVYPEQYTSSDGGCIDGAVKNATPPLGKYNMAPYFHMTHACEYAYNTAHLTENGFAYWNKRGFMQRDFLPDFADRFAKLWKYIKEHTPALPHRCTAFLSEIPHDEDRYERVDGLMNLFNISEVGLGYVYEVSRTSGLPGGFALDYKSLLLLDETMTDLLILPSLSEADEAALTKIRTLYEKGVSLLAVSDVTGLEDLFGVTPARERMTIEQLEDENGEREAIAPQPAEFFYRAEDAETVLYAIDAQSGEKRPAILRKGRTALINAPVTQLGHRTYTNPDAGLFLENISPMMRKTVTSLLRELSTPEVRVITDSDCGLTYFKDTDGSDLLLAIDYAYTDHVTNQDETTRSRILFTADCYHGAESIYGPAPIPLIEDGILRGIELTLRREESAIIKLI